MIQVPLDMNDVQWGSNVQGFIDPTDIAIALRLFAQGDWGDSNYWEGASADRALRYGGWITAYFRDRNGRRFVVSYCAGKYCTVTVAERQ